MCEASDADLLRAIRPARPAAAGHLYVGEGGFKATWFMDSDGNILSLIEEG